MKSTSYIFLTCFTIFISACSKEQKDVPAGINNIQPNEVVAKGRAVPPKNVTQPKVIDALPTKVPVGKPSVIILLVTSIAIPENLPVFQLDTTNLKAITPGVDGIPMPEIVEALDSPFLAGTPTVVQAKDMTFRDQSQAKFSFFGKLHGLNSANIFDMLQDKLGNLWLATWNGGVTKYDGKQFTHFTTKQGMADNKVQAILEDSRGNLWFGTYGGGVVKYDGKYFTTYTKRQGLCGNIVYTLLEDSSGNIWIGTEDGGVSKYDGKTFTNFSNKKSLIGSGSRSIYEDKRGTIWFGTFGQGVLKYDGKTFVQYVIADGWGNGMVHCILPDKSGNIWFGTNSGAVKFDGKNFTKYTGKAGLTDNMVSSIVEDTFGNIWFGTLEDGLFKYNGNRIEAIENGKANNTMPAHDLKIVDGKYVKTFERFTEYEGLCSNSVPSLFEDKWGNLWIGTHNGLAKYNGFLFNHFTSKDGLGDNTILSIEQDSKKNLWFGTGVAGVVKFDGYTFTRYAEDQGLINNMVFSILEKGDDLWFGTNLGVTKFNGSYFYRYDSLVVAPYISMHNAFNGDIWFASDGAIRYNEKGYAKFTKTEGLCHNGTKTILEDSMGNLWIGTDGGITQIIPATNQQPTSFIHFTEKNGLSSNWITSSIKDQHGNFWFGTTGGGINLYREPKNGRPASFVHFTEKEGLASNYVGSLIEDHLGNIWVGTRLGVSKMDHDIVERLSTGKKTSIQNENVFFKNYTYEDGFLGVGCNTRAMIEDDKGTIWIGANDRLTALYPQTDKNDTIPPTIQLTGIDLFNESIDWATLENNTDTTLTLGNRVQIHDCTFSGISNWYSIPQQLSLAYDNNYLTFNFLGITTHRSSQVKYQYKLEGLEEHWNAITQKSEANYSHLPYGTYTFKVKARNGEGYWSNALAYTMTIRPPWWLTWWFISLALTAFILALVGLFRFRVSALSAQKRYLLQMVEQRTGELRESLDQKEALLKEIHHRVKNNLEVISSLLMLQTEGIIDDQAKAALVESQSRVQSIALIHHKLYRNEEMAKVEFHGFASDLFKQIHKVFAKPGITVDLQNSKSDVQVDIDTAVPLGLILNELLTNAFKYAIKPEHKNAIFIQLQDVKGEGQEGVHYVLTFRDSGPGLPASFDLQKTSSFGMRVIQLLARQLGGQVKYYYDNGSVFEIPFFRSKQKL